MNNLMKAVDDGLHYQGTVGMGEPVRFIEYQSVHKSGGDLYRFIYRQAFGTIPVCPHHKGNISGRLHWRIPF